MVVLPGRRAFRAHPRSRGENSVSGPPACAARGSSPLTRGKHFCSANDVFHLGLIPAHAGKTGHADCRRRQDRAHPRSRGENKARERPGSQRFGSSPLTRGKHRVPGRGHHRHGLIPAHAGKTTFGCTSCGEHGAHPRSRGENPISRAASAAEDGSSPLTRGKLVATSTGTAPSGLIPAHAGKTPRRRTSSAALPAHPRSRGENTVRTSRTETFKGSSPLTRGKRNHPATQQAPKGLIPAHAGKTTHNKAIDISGWAHPRSRGENIVS